MQSRARTRPRSTGCGRRLVKLDLAALERAGVVEAGCRRHCAHPSRSRWLVLRPNPDVRPGTGLRLIDAPSPTTQTPQATEGCDPKETSIILPQGKGGISRK